MKKPRREKKLRVPRKQSSVSDPSHARSTKSLSFFTRARVAGAFRSLKPTFVLRDVSTSLVLTWSSIFLTIINLSFFKIWFLNETAKWGILEFGNWLNIGYLLLIQISKMVYILNSKLEILIFGHIKILIY